jgi:PAS domain S-box-containing protein
MKLRLQAKYTLSITALILAVSAVVAFTLHYLYRQTTVEMTTAGMAVLDETLAREVVADGSELVSLLSTNVAAALASGDGAAVRAVLASGLQGRHVHYVAAADRKGRSYHVGASAGQAATHVPASLEVVRDTEALVITAPVVFRRETVGSLRVGFSLEAMKPRQQALKTALEKVQASSHRTQQVALATILIALLLTGILLGGAMARQLSRPIRALVASLRDVAEGDLSNSLPTSSGHDEIADLTTAFTLMRDSLGKTTVSRDFLCNIIDSLNEGLVVTGPAGEIRLANRALGDTFGYPPEALVGKPFGALTALHDFPAANHDKATESWFRHRQGNLIPVAVSRSVIGSGDMQEHVYVISDITQRKRLEEELWAYRSRLELLVVERTKELTAAVHELESFSYSVSHDLHAPLRAINGFGSALHEDYYQHLDEAGRDYLDRMRKATVRMGRLIDGLLTLTRVVRSEIRKEPVDLSAAASEIATEMASHDPRRQVTFRIAPTLNALGDPSHLRLLLQNLFGNAWKFTAKGGSALIEFNQTEVDGVRAFFVRDNGPGFDPEFARGLFQPFCRLHESDEFPGTGIGLATVKRVVQRHGGQVWAESDAGLGATFYFTLPEDQPPSQVEESRVSSRAPLSNNISSQRPSVTA